MQNQSKIYALFVGINHYKYINNLGGCVVDAENIKDYIQKASEAQNREFKAKELHDSGATKDAIITHFNDHLGQATENDICLFYFAGHGAQEKAHPAFINYELDKKLELLICHDSHPEYSKTFLADKELRFLIQQLYEGTNAEIVTIFDCCHSGTNVRSSTLIPRQAFINGTRTGLVVESRDWEGFTFGKKIKETKAIEAASLEDILPLGKYIQLAACEDQEFAYEDKGMGVFTSNLVDLLRQTKGDITYESLVNILRLKIRGSYKQTPQLDIQGDETEENLSFKSFLGGITQHQNQIANIAYNQREKIWLLAMGAIHGISKTSPKLQIELLNDQEQSIATAEIKEVQLNHTQLRFNPGVQINKAHAYKVKITGLIATPLKVHCSGNEQGVKLFKDYCNDSDNSTSSFQLVESPIIAEYWVEATNDAYYIKLPLNSLPITKKIIGYNLESTAILSRYLEHIARWTFIKNLENSNASFEPNPPLEVEIVTKQNNGSNKKIDIKNNIAEIEYTDIPDKSSQKPPKVALNLNIKNTSNQEYYCGVFYLAQDFDIYVSLKKSIRYIRIPAGETWNVLDGQYITDAQSSYIKRDNWDAETHYFKIIISTETFSFTQLKQENLPPPEEDIETPEPIEPNRGTASTRGIPSLGVLERRTRKFEEDELEAAGWISQLIELKMLNPYYQKPEQPQI